MTARERFLVEFHDAHPGITSRAMARGGSYERLAAHARGDVLDLGCGDGYLLSRLPRAGTVSVGCDLSGGELQAARRRGAAVVRANAAQLPFADGSFDTVLSHLAFMLMPAELVAREIRRVLRPGGTFAAILGGGPTAEGDDAFHRYLAIAGRTGVALVDRAARSEAGWRTLFPGWTIAFERIVLDLGGTLDEVWTVLGSSYEPADRDAFAASVADLGARIPLAMVVWLATARR